MEAISTDLSLESVAGYYLNRTGRGHNEERKEEEIIHLKNLVTKNCHNVHIVNATVRRGSSTASHGQNQRSGLPSPAEALLEEPVAKHREE